MSESELILKAGDIVKSIITFIRDTRNKYNIPKDRLVLYIDFYSKEIESLDFLIYQWEGGIIKYNMGNLIKIEYSLYELFEKDFYFESTTIEGYNVYLELPGVVKELQLNDFLEEKNRLEIQKIKYKNKLSDEKFISKAPKDIVDAERKKINDAEIKIQNINANMLMLRCGKEYYELLIRFGTIEHINWNIQHQRELETKFEPYEPEWFNEVYNPHISSEEIKKLHFKII